MERFLSLDRILAFRVDTGYSFALPIGYVRGAAYRVEGKGSQADENKVAALLLATADDPPTLSTH